MSWPGKLLYFQLLIITRRISRYYSDQLIDLGITQSQSFLLFSLLEHDGLIMQELAECLQIEKPAITGLVDRLTLLNLVERRSTHENRRIIRVFLTPDGRQAAEKALAIAEGYNIHITKCLPGEVISGLEEALIKLES